VWKNYARRTNRQAPRYRYYTFDDAATLAAARADITGFVSRLEKRAILDEVQHVPDLFAALKPIVDANRNCTRFILTGSSNVLLIPRLSDFLAGRMEILRLYPLSQVELEHRRAAWYPPRRHRGKGSELRP
jgi:predicted AAA+ superfamily ATPase